MNAARLVLFSFLSTGLFFALPEKALAETKTKESLVSKTRELILLEEQLLDLSPKLEELKRQLSLHKPPRLLKGLQKRTYISPISPVESLKPWKIKGIEGLMAGELPLSPPSIGPFDSPLHPFAAFISYYKGAWQSSNIGVLGVAYMPEGELQLDTTLELSMRTTDGQAIGVKAAQDLHWKQDDNGGWHLIAWIQKSCRIITSPTPLFSDGMESILPGHSARYAVHEFRKHSMVKQLLQTDGIPIPQTRYAPFITLENSNQYPSVSLTDFNSDGLEDIFLCSDFDRCAALVNQGDGTYKDQTIRLGLNFPYLVNCAIFADFDNDGDADAIIGRPLDPALYLENVEGRFRDVTAEKAPHLGSIYFISAMSVSDINRDGIPDLYLSTYAPISRDNHFAELGMTTSEDWQRLKQLEKDEHRWLNLRGLPNHLFFGGEKGTLLHVKDPGPLAQWRRSFQSVWADLDGDGDDDVYLCNDFAPDDLLLNETPRGASQPVFRSVFNEAISKDSVGFGMGASFGDYDSDGDLDLYVSNMYSKAGKRIIRQIGKVDERTLAAVRGNFLFENRDGKLIQRAGADDLYVHKVGWSYGGQWGDLNNDGLLDLYVPSGFYSSSEGYTNFVDT